MNRQRIVSGVLILLFTIGVMLPFVQSYYITRADEFYEQENYDKSISSYSIAILLTPLSFKKRASAYFGRAEARGLRTYRTNIGDAEFITAINDLHSAIKFDNTVSDYYLLRGSIYANLGAYPEAFRDFNMALELEGDMPFWSLIRIGYLERRFSNFETALISFEKVIKYRAPKIVMPPNYHKARTYLMLNDFQESIDAINQGLIAQPDYGEAFILKGCALAKLGKYNDAVDSYRMGIQYIQHANDRNEQQFPSTRHNMSIIKKELAILKRGADPSAIIYPDEINKLCTQTWDQLYFDKLRERSKLLANQ